MANGRVREYIGARYVPVFADPVEWDITSTYEPLMMVQYRGETYMTKQYVPADIPLPSVGEGEESNDYWVHMSNWNAQVEGYREEVLRYADEVQTFDGRIDSLEDALPIADYSSSNTISDAIENEETARKNQDSIRAITFEKVADMKNSTNLQAGMFCHTLGYIDNGIGEGWYYIDDDSDTSDEIFIIDCQDNLHAHLIWNEKDFNIGWLGVINNGNVINFGNTLTDGLRIYVQKEISCDVEWFDDYPTVTRIIFEDYKINQGTYNAHYAMEYTVDENNNDSPTVLAGRSNTALMLVNDGKDTASTGGQNHWCSIFFGDGFTQDGFVNSYAYIQAAKDSSNNRFISFRNYDSTNSIDEAMLTLGGDLTAHFGGTTASGQDFSVYNNAKRTALQTGLMGETAAYLNFFIGATSPDRYYIAADGNGLNINNTLKTKDDYVILNARTFITKQTVSGAAVTVPDNASVLIVNNASATTITSMTGGQNDQFLLLIFANGNTTLPHGTGVFNLAGGTNWTPTYLSSILLWKNSSYSNAWIEIFRSEH